MFGVHGMYNQCVKHFISSTDIRQAVIYRVDFRFGYTPYIFTFLSIQMSHKVSCDRYFSMKLQNVLFVTSREGLWTVHTRVSGIASKTKFYNAIKSQCNTQ